MHWDYTNFMWHCLLKWHLHWEGKSFRVSVALGWSNGAYMYINKRSFYTESMSSFVAFPSEMVAFAANRYEFQDINGLGLIKWWLNVSIKYIVWFALILYRLSHIAPRNDPTHSEYVIFTSFMVSVTLGWSKDAYMCMNKLPDVISIDMQTLWYCPQNYWIHRDMFL